MLTLIGESHPKNVMPDCILLLAKIEIDCKANESGAWKKVFPVLMTYVPYICVEQIPNSDEFEAYLPPGRLLCNRTGKTSEMAFHNCFVGIAQSLQCRANAGAVICPYDPTWQLS
jgi:hypothetical protein